VEHWLREDVAPVYDAMQAKPGRAISGKKVFAAVKAHHAKRSKTT
jgi:antitoxin ParD1/3/4